MQHLDWKLLTAFEAVARHGSFSRAASELNVLQPAISRRVARLEEDLGAMLLERTRPTVTLTADGHVLFRAVSGSMTQVQMAVAQIERARPEVALTVNTTIGFASCFMMQRLNTFREQHPDISIELVSRDLNDGYRSEACDVVICFDDPKRMPGVEQRLIFEETMIPVCAPSFLERGPIPLETLYTQPLLQLPVGNHRGDWQIFLEDLGQPDPPPDPARRYTSFMVYLQAALNGDGIAIGWRYLLDDLLASGKLVRAVDHEVRWLRGYYCCITERARENAAARAFVEWCETLTEA